jgi:hypothetical protein
MSDQADVTGRDTYLLVEDLRRSAACQSSFGQTTTLSI